MESRQRSSRSMAFRQNGVERWIKSWICTNLESGYKRSRAGAKMMGRYEFGGPIGVTAMMVGFPVLMCELPGGESSLTIPDYLFICLWFYDGKFAHPDTVDDIGPFFRRIGLQVYDVGLGCTADTDSS